MKTYYELISEIHREIIRDLNAVAYSKSQKKLSELESKIKAHFVLEEKIVLPSIAIGCASPPIAEWTMMISRQHGHILSCLEVIMKKLTNLVCPPDKKSTLEICALFDDFVDEITSHSLEEDTKFERLFKDNQKVRQLAASLRPKHLTP